MGGDIEKIHIVGRYFVEIWRAAGMDLRNVKFLWCSEEINKHSNEYWQNVINVASKNNIDRIKRCCQIMGRQEGDSLQASQMERKRLISWKARREKIYSLYCLM